MGLYTGQSCVKKEKEVEREKGLEKEQQHKRRMEREVSVLKQKRKIVIQTESMKISYWFWATSPLGSSADCLWSIREHEVKNRKARDCRKKVSLMGRRLRVVEFREVMTDYR